MNDQTIQCFKYLNNNEIIEMYLSGIPIFGLGYSQCILSLTDTVANDYYLTIYCNYCNCLVTLSFFAIRDRLCMFH